MIYRNLFLIIISIFFHPSYGNVDICLRPLSDREIGIFLKPNLNFSGIVSNIVFTIKYPNSPTLKLGEIIQNDHQRGFLMIRRSGEEIITNSSKYETFIGFGMTPLSSMNYEWSCGEEYEIAIIEAENPDMFSLIDDSLTEQSNLNYFLSLGGIDMTGNIETPDSTQSLNTGNSSDFTIYPNPALNLIIIRSNPLITSFILYIRDESNRILFESEIFSNEFIFNATKLKSGFYLIELRHGNKSFFKKEVKS